jgi:hypothetical protein
MSNDNWINPDVDSAYITKAWAGFKGSSQHHVSAELGMWVEPEDAKTWNESTHALMSRFATPESQAEAHSKMITLVATQALAMVPRAARIRMLQQSLAEELGGAS